VRCYCPAQSHSRAETLPGVFRPRCPVVACLAMMAFMCIPPMAIGMIRAWLRRRAQPPAAKAPGPIEAARAER